MKRIIDYKKIDLTDSEWQLYQEICKAYDKPNFQGKSLFAGLFETDEDGIIIFLRPPTNYTSMEVFMFLMAVMAQQHLRNCYSRFDELKAAEEELAKRLKEKEEKLDLLIARLEKTVEHSS